MKPPRFKSRAQRKCWLAQRSNRAGCSYARNLLVSLARAWEKPNTHLTAVHLNVVAARLLVQHAGKRMAPGVHKRLRRSLARYDVERLMLEAARRLHGPCYLNFAIPDNLEDQRVRVMGEPQAMYEHYV